MGVLLICLGIVAVLFAVVAIVHLHVERPDMDWIEQQLKDCDEHSRD